MRSPVAILTLSLALACNRSPEVGPEPKPVEIAPVNASAAVSPAAAPRPSAFKLPATERVVAIGDVHGDLRALRGALRLAGAIDSDDEWIGKGLTVVQTGDQLDRGDQDREVLDVLEKLETAAKAKGGALVVLNGNHELMNASFDFRYVTRRSFESFREFSSRARGAAERVPEDERGRAAAFAPGAPYALKLARHLTVALVGDTLFAHGGVLPAHLDYGLARLNADAQSFLAGERPSPPPALAAEDSPVWTRFYGGAMDAAGCEVLGRVLKETGAKRLVVGHTVQKDGINGACQDRLFRIDVGLSAYYGDHPAQVLELTAAGARVLTAGAAPPPSSTGAGKKSQPKDSALHSAP
jgi:Calcineurin-like phosphoesterase